MGLVLFQTGQDDGMGRIDLPAGHFRAPLSLPGPVV
jgi:hypothetical protein